MLTTWIGDVRCGVRRLWAHRGYSLLAVLTLALGVGGTAASFGVARGVLFDPLPYLHAREVGIFWKKTDWTEEEFLYIRGRVPGFQSVALYRQRDVECRRSIRSRLRLQERRMLVGVLAAFVPAWRAP